jgi:4-hydroxybenzoate polyprenyltransferase
VVLGLATIAGAASMAAAILAASMLLIQFCIGTVNDLADQQLDTLTKPSKPLPAGLLTRRAALALAIASGTAGLALTLPFGLIVLLVAFAGLGAGLAYDLWLKPTRWAWACFSVALPLLPIFAWQGAAGTLPPRAEVLLPLAALAGPALQLANGLVDIERDRMARLSTLPVRLGWRRSLRLMVVLLLAIHGVVWAMLAGAPVSSPTLLALALAAVLAALGALLTAAPTSARREWGWRAQAGATALLALAWLAAIG